MRGRSELPREIGLQLRMAVALALSGALLAAVVGALLYVTLFVESGWSLAVLVAVIVGIGAVRVLGSATRMRARPVPKGAERRLRRAVQRLAVVADEPPPKSAVIRSDVPLSWTFAPPRGTPTIHVTTGLLDRLEDAELQAVVGHEIGHVIHRDALVVTLLAGPPAYFLAGLRQMVDDDPFRGAIGALTFLVLLGLPVFVMLLLSRLVCRHRELAADRAAAVLTGSPAAVAAALMAVDRDLSAQRDRDLRRVAPRDAFHFVPARSPRFVGRLWATHPRLRRRVERMQRLEVGLQR